MKEQEQEHLETFNKLIVERRVRPTALLPLWNIAGFALGIYIYGVFLCIILDLLHVSLHVYVDQLSED